MRFLIKNAGQLLTFKGPAGPRSGAAMRDVGLIKDGAVLVEEGRIVAAGPKAEVMAAPGADKARIVDAEGRVVMPGFVDSHAHPVFIAPRLADFSARIGGRAYE